MFVVKLPHVGQIQFPVAQNVINKKHIKHAEGNKYCCSTHRSKPQNYVEMSQFF